MGGIAAKVKGKSSVLIEIKSRKYSPSSWQTRPAASITHTAGARVTLLKAPPFLGRPLGNASREESF